MKDVIDLFLEVYMYVISGIFEMIYLKVVEVGVDIIDIVIFFFVGGMS